MTPRPMRRAGRPRRRSQAIFEAIEQSRIESIGANAMGGVRNSLTAALLEQSVERKGLARITDRANAPMADVLSLLVRELTGDAPPEGARAMVDLFRADVEARASADLDRQPAVGDQAAFGKVARAILHDLDLGDADVDPSEGSEEDAGDEEQSQTSESDDGDGDGQTPEGASMEETGSSESDAQEGRNRWWSPTRTPPR